MIAKLILRLVLVAIQIALVVHFAGSWPFGAVLHMLLGLIFAHDAAVAIEVAIERAARRSVVEARLAGISRTAHRKDV